MNTLHSQEAFFYNRWRASFAKPVRQFLDFRFGLPEGYRTLDNTNFTEVRSSQMADVLRQHGFFVDQLIEFGYAPETYFQLRNPDQPLPDPGTFAPAPDMTAPTGAPRPFSKWFMQHSTDFEQGLDKDPAGIGTLYESSGKPVDTYDIGAWWIDPITKFKYEKVIWRVSNSLPVAWERIE